MTTNPASSSTHIRHLSSSSSSQPNTAPPSEETPAELTAVVDELLEGLSSKFQGVSGEMFQKMDEMSRRIDALEEALRADAVVKTETKGK